MTLRPLSSEAASDRLAARFRKTFGTSDGRSSSVGTQAILRFARPVCYQGFPDEALPEELQDANPFGIWRMVDGRMTQEANLSEITNQE
jgi:hypothetical protein